MRDAVDVELVPEIMAPRVLNRLRGAIADSETLRAAVAYWCIRPGAVSQDLVARFSGEGFLCVDIHLPTDIDALYEMNQAGANIYLHLLHPNPQPGDLRGKLPEHLLHSKILLFDLPEGRAALWVGSHNWTRRALSGLNIEVSTVHRLGKDHGLYRAAAKFLTDVRSLCVPFDPTARIYYKWLQGQNVDEEVAWVVEIESEQAAALSATRVTIFEHSEEQYRNLKKVDKDVVVSAVDPATSNEYLYEGVIVDTGRMSQANVEFGSRIHGFHDGTERPRVFGPIAPELQRVTAATAWATVLLGDPFSESMGLFELPPGERWTVHPEDSFEKRVPEDVRDLFEKPKRALVSRPVSKEQFEGKSRPEEGSAMISVEHSLVRRMAIRKKH